MLINDELLGVALAERFDEIVGEIEPSLALRERVARDLRAERSTRRKRLSRRRALAAAMPVAAAVTAAVVTFGASGAAPAFAVVQESDGSVAVTIRDFSGMKGANARLRELGVRRLVVVPMSHGCPFHIEVSYVRGRRSTVSVQPAQVATGTVLLVAVEKLAGGNVKLATGHITGVAPPCVSTTQPGAVTAAVATAAGSRLLRTAWTLAGNAAPSCGAPSGAVTAPNEYGLA